MHPSTNGLINHFNPSTNPSYQSINQSIISTQVADADAALDSDPFRSYPPADPWLQPPWGDAAVQGRGKGEAAAPAQWARAPFDATAPPPAPPAPPAVPVHGMGGAVGSFALNVKLFVKPERREAFLEW